MRTRKDDLISDEFKPIICEKIKEARTRYNYSLEDLAKALNYKKIAKRFINMKQVL